MSIRKSGHSSSDQSPRRILTTGPSAGGFKEASLGAASRAPLIQLLMDLPHTQLIILSTIGGKDDPEVMGQRIQRCICNFKLVCRDGNKQLFKNLIFLSDEHKAGLAQYKSSQLAKWHSAQQALLNEQTLALALDGSPVLDLRSWKWELVSLFLGKTCQNFSFEKLCIDGRKILGTANTVLAHEDWDLVINFLLRHAKLADRPVVTISLDNHFGLSSKMETLVKALGHYGNGEFDLRLFANTDSDVVLSRLSEVASSRLLRKLRLHLGAELTTDFRQRIDRSLSTISSLESLGLEVLCCEQLPPMLKSAAENKNLQDLSLNMDEGDLKNLEKLPELLKAFPKLHSLCVLVQWDAPKEEVIALKKALMGQFPKLELQIYWRDLGQAPVLI